MDKLKLWLSGMSIIVSFLGLVLSILLWSHWFGSLRIYLDYFEYEFFWDDYYFSPFLFVFLGILLGVISLFIRNKNARNTTGVIGVIIGLIVFCWTLFVFGVNAMAS